LVRQAAAGDRAQCLSSGDDVEEHLHFARSPWRRRQVASSSSAAVRFSAISSSISMVKSAYSNWRRRVWLPAAAAAGCAGGGFHDLRRLNATTLVVEGIDVKTAQTRLGHADPRTTLAVYASAPASIDRAAADVIGDRFFGPESKEAQKPRNLRAISAPSAPVDSDP
jgi:Phage integrase family